MTFSHPEVVAAARRDFIPVWESVSALDRAIWHLGDGKEVVSAATGDIALYFCRPDGVVFDCLPSLASVSATRDAIAAAAAFYRESGGAPDEAILRHAAERATSLREELRTSIEDVERILRVCEDIPAGFDRLQRCRASSRLLAVSFH